MFGSMATIACWINQPINWELLLMASALSRRFGKNDILELGFMRKAGNYFDD